MKRRQACVLLILLCLLPTHALADEGAEATLTFEVADAPTSLELTSDGVNEDGRTKVPGDPVITRYRLRDGNGLDDITLLDTRYERLAPDGRWVRFHGHALRDVDGGNRSVTDLTLEDRYGPNPAPEGAYRVVLSATNRTGEELAVNRTFEILDVRPYLARANLSREAVVPDHPVSLDVTLGLADDNFAALGGFDGPAAFDTLTVKLYRYTRVVTDPAWSLRLGDVAAEAGVLALNLTDQTPLHHTWPLEGAGLRFDGTLEVPAGVDAGDYRLSVYHTDAGRRSLLDTLPFTVRELPFPENATAPTRVRAGEPLPATADLPAWASLRTRLLDRNGTALLPAAWDAGGPGATATLDVPGNLSQGEYVLELAALSGPDGEPVPDGRGGYQNALTLPVAVEVLGPHVNLTIAGPDRVAGDAPLRLNLTTSGVDTLTWNLTGPEGAVANASARLTDRGHGAWTLRAGDLAPGAYELTAHGSGAAGNASDNATFHVQAWAGLRIPHARANLTDGRAEVAVEHRGNAPAHRVMVATGIVAGPDSRATLEGADLLFVVDGEVRAQGTLENGTLLLEGPAALLRPGEAATLRVEAALPPGLDAGAYELPLRLLLAPGARS